MLSDISFIFFSSNSLVKSAGVWKGYQNGIEICHILSIKIIPYPEENKMKLFFEKMIEKGQKWKFGILPPTVVEDSRFIQIKFHSLIIK